MDHCATERRPGRGVPSAIPTGLAATSLLLAATMDPRPLRIAVSLKPAYRTPIGAPARQAVAEARRLVDELGHETTEQDPEYGRLRPLIGPRLLRGIHDDLQDLDDVHQLEARTRRLARLGRLVSAARVARTRSQEPARAAQINSLFKSHDVLITPVVAQPPALADMWANRGLLRNLLASTPWIT